MSAASQHFQSQAVTILVVATGALGFGLFGAAEYRVSMEFLPTAMLMATVLVLVAYVVLVWSVRRILESDDVTGKDVVRGPLLCLLLIILYSSCISLIGIFDNLA